MRVLEALGIEATKSPIWVRVEVVTLLTDYGILRTCSYKIIDKNIQLGYREPSFSCASFKALLLVGLFIILTLTIYEFLSSICLIKPQLIKKSLDSSPIMYTIPELRDPSLFIDKAYVNGEFVTAISGKTFEVHDPATGKLVGTCPEMDSEDVLEAVAAATEAFSTFRHTLPRERADLLRKWYDLVIKNAEDLATLITWENGKPLADSRKEVTYAANFLSWFSEEAPRVYGDTIPSTIPGNRTMTLKQPVGVCGLITPWNFPAAMITRKIGPALAAGCTVVVKSPGETPFTCNALAELSRRARVPKGVVNFVTALENTAEVGKVITMDPRIKKISFTGSTNVGKLLMRQASDTMKKVSFELGGNSAFIVFDDCPDLDMAVEGVIASKFRGSGQTCVCANRIFVQRGM